MTEHDDVLDDLVRRARAGDHTAFSAIYERFADRLYRFVLFRSGDAAEAEDIVQGVFIKVIEALPRYEMRGVPFATWLFRVARNATIDHLRTRRPVEPLDTELEWVAPDRGPEDLALAGVELDAVAAALQRLTSEQRDVIAYRFFAGLSAAEIGVLMGKREGTIRALQFRALGALRRLLAAETAEVAR